MPIYEYACSSCGRSIDVIHGINADGPTTCQFCGGTMKKQLTAPAIHFKGSGWAKKDARSAAAPAAGAVAKQDDGSAGAKQDDGSAPAPAASPSSGDAAPATPAAAPAPAAAPSTTPTTSTTGS